MRRRDDEEFQKRLNEAKRRVDNHLQEHGGNLSLLIKDGIPAEVRCVQLVQWGTDNNNIRTVRVPLQLPMKDEVLIKSYAWYKLEFFKANLKFQLLCFTLAVFLSTIC